MIRRNKIIASVAVSVMTGVLVAGNLAPLQGYKNCKVFSSKRY